MFTAAPVFAAQVKEDPIEAETLAIAKTLRCAVCQNQPVAESNSDLARDMRAIIREQLKAGKSRDEIVKYFVDRYGNYVLLKPPVTGPGTIVWLGPLALLTVVGTSGFFFLRRRLRVPLPPVPPLSEKDKERVRDARKEDDQ
ncbi:MAG: cytochrome c-type biogenesis protein CcmH [Gammaproteobacteria bacterium]|nr:cytochrome c-type biogenesis protein CcmH [Gammaproteobacteria bacterium]